MDAPVFSESKQDDERIGVASVMVLTLKRMMLRVLLTLQGGILAFKRRMMFANRPKIPPLYLVEGRMWAESGVWPPSQNYLYVPMSILTPQTEGASSWYFVNHYPQRFSDFSDTYQLPIRPILRLAESKHGPAVDKWIVALEHWGFSRPAPQHPLNWVQYKLNRSDAKRVRDRVGQFLQRAVIEKNGADSNTVTVRVWK